jgi:hypothetical protein
MKSVGEAIDLANARALILNINHAYGVDHILYDVERDLQDRLDPIFDMCQAMYSFWRIRRDEITSNGR